MHKRNENLSQNVLSEGVSVPMSSFRGKSDFKDVLTFIMST